MGLTRVEEVGKRAGVLQFSCKVVTVAGTNGKGSTVATLSHLLQAAGLRVGTYTSPHLFRINERIQINGQNVSDELLCQALQYIDNYRQHTHLTYFEYTTLAAFYIFQQAPLDIVLLEVGLGGRLDAVNVVDTSLAIVTSIGLDHQEYLGQTHESIAAEKAGIFRSQIPVVLGHTAAISTLLSQTQALQNTVYLEKQHFDYQGGDNLWQFRELVRELPIHYLPRTSVSLAMAAYTILGEMGFSLPSLNTVVFSLRGLMMTGRCQLLVHNQIKLIFDVGHNEAASKWLAARLKEMPIKGKIIALWASLKDKSLAAIVSPLKDMVDTWCLGDLSAATPRAATPEMLQAALCGQQKGKTLIYSSIAQALDGALTIATKIDCVVIFGSFYTVAKALAEFSKYGNDFQGNGLLQTTTI
jgi:dihydrofolate synthase/folylpolyglutamate synthase